jgi:hypothetical protein
MQRSFVALCLLASLGLPAAAQDSERAAVLATVQKLFDAMRTRDTILLQQAFDTSGRLIRENTRGPAPAVGHTTPSQFGAGFNRAPAGAVWNERIYDPEVRIDGNVAQVWAYYTFHVGSTFNHCGVDAFMLLKVRGTWKITQVADTSRQQGCTHTEPPGGL